MDAAATYLPDATASTSTGDEVNDARVVTAYDKDKFGIASVTVVHMNDSWVVLSARTCQ